MKITRRRLSEIIEQEVRARLIEKGDKPKKQGKKKEPAPEKPETAAADSEVDIQPQPGGGGPDPIASAPPIDGGMNDQDGDGMPDPGSVDPTDGEGEDDEEALDADGNAGEDPSGAVNNEVSGKTIQAVTIEPKSQVLPGAKEIVLAFNESTDPLRILVTQTGQVKFFWRGQLHDLP